MNNLFEFFNQKNDCELLIVSDDKQAQVAHDVVAYHQKQPFVLADFRANFGDDLLSFSEELQSITKTLNAYYNHKKQDKVLIVPLRTATYPMPKAQCFDSFEIEFASTVDIEAF